MSDKMSLTQGAIRTNMTRRVFFANEFTILGPNMHYTFLQEVLKTKPEWYTRTKPGQYDFNISSTKYPVVRSFTRLLGNLPFTTDLLILGIVVQESGISEKGARMNVLDQVGQSQFRIIINLREFEGGVRVKRDGANIPNGPSIIQVYAPEGQLEIPAYQSYGVILPEHSSKISICAPACPQGKHIVLPHTYFVVIDCYIKNNAAIGEIIAKMARARPPDKAVLTKFLKDMNKAAGEGEDDGDAQALQDALSGATDKADIDNAVSKAIQISTEKNQAKEETKEEFA
jgi:hypothetical protein